MFWIREYLLSKTAQGTEGLCVDMFKIKRSI